MVFSSRILISFQLPVQLLLFFLSFFLFFKISFIFSSVAVFHFFQVAMLAKSSLSIMNRERGLFSYKKVTLGC